MDTSIIERYNKLAGRIETLQSDFDTKEEQINTSLVLIDDMSKAQWILNEVQKITQQRLKHTIESLVTMAIKAVYDRPFGLELLFEQKRDKMECQPLIYEIVNGEKEYYDDPENDLGGGIVDVCSFALRIILWTMEKPQRRNIFILDEPGKNLGELLPLFGQMLKEVSHKLKFQLVIITHDEALIEAADVTYRVQHDGRESKVTLVEG